MVTVKEVEFTRGDDGVNVVVFVLALYETVAAINTFDELRNSILVLFIVDAFIASLKTAEAVELAATPVAPFTGLTLVMVGGVLSTVPAALLISKIAVLDCCPVGALTPSV